MRKGFTLIETLFYSLIVAVVLTLSLLAAYQLIASEDRVTYRRELTENQKFLLEKILWVLQSVSTVNSPVAGSGAALSVNKLNYAYNPLVFSLVNGTVQLASGATTTPISNSYVMVSSLNFTHRLLSGKSSVQISATLNNKVGTATIDTSILVK